MDLSFNLDDTVGAIAIGEGNEPIVHPNWPTLLARMVAAREASAALARDVRYETIAMRGSFDEFAAACVTSYATSLQAVNPNDSGNRKPGGNMFSPVAGLTRTGGRG